MIKIESLSAKNMIRVTGLTLAAAMMCSTVFAIDNPDAPDYIEAFHTKSKKFETAIEGSSDNGRAYAEATHNYEKFLDSELNTAYRMLQAKLAETQKSQLRESQKAWIQYRDKEIEFVDANWTQQNFGSSSSISRHNYRATIIRERVEQLLNYLKNY